MKKSQATVGRISSYRVVKDRKFLRVGENAISEQKERKIKQMDRYLAITQYSST